MPSDKRSPRKLAHLVLVGCLTGVLGFSLAGCPGGTGPTLSPEAQAKAKQNIEKRWNKASVKPGRKNS